MNHNLSVKRNKDNASSRYEPKQNAYIGILKGWSEGNRKGTPLEGEVSSFDYLCSHSCKPPNNLYVFIRLQIMCFDSCCKRSQANVDP